MKDVELDTTPNDGLAESQSGSPVATMLQANVRGRVQGVGYRMFVLHHARDLALRGYVRNQPDRSVYVLARGPRPALERLLNLLWKGPFGAHVSQVETVWTEGQAEELGAEFEVRA